MNAAANAAVPSYVPIVVTGPNTSWSLSGAQFIGSAVVRTTGPTK